MVRIFLISLLFLTHWSSAQSSCVIKLQDAHTLEQIQISEITFVNQKKHSIDSLTNSLIIEKARGKKLNIHTKNYKEFTRKIDFRKHKGDTLVLHLLPSKNLIQSRYQELYESMGVPKDTLIFENQAALKNHLSAYIYPLISYAMDSCKNGLCNYNNTYSFHFIFEASNGVYSLKTCDQTKSYAYSCDSLDNALDRLITIYPYFLLAEEENTFRIRISISPNLRNNSINKRTY
ncbi:hypothetical protein SAMN05216474_0054 [Lishizhenia tianjinensis]|uniref:TonB protein C-terminal n=1 Tax=Lishizhenia tianjinensis TaxID=477690 RepID=A0A1I6XB01_9FLAO|nr:hypothetical protein [Lishizhenia tianjinensis]SFT35313.1 hypothetical protein SAMN05216474_0054 [Lishizhenia tianjinensis]